MKPKKKNENFVQLEIMISLPMNIIGFSRNFVEEKIQFL
jgi:hypothetical protein